MRLNIGNTMGGICLLMVILCSNLGFCADETWKAEFDDICSKTEDSMTLTREQLKQLIERADKLKAIIEKLDESSRKVYRKRLQLCRDLYDFVLKTKEQEKSQ